jgi:antibiotic biosynthesis monooxygenase (ABM) superfamily enzyme
VIVRYWRGWTHPSKADSYEQLLTGVVFPSIAARDLRGYRGIYLLRRDLGEDVEFATIMIFDSLEIVRAFAGKDYEQAYVPPSARDLLRRFDQKAAHFDLIQAPEWAPF